MLDFQYQSIVSKETEFDLKVKVDLECSSRPRYQTVRPPQDLKPICVALKRYISAKYLAFISDDFSPGC